MIRIAIDGTASSGKGSLARRVAQSLKFSYIDTGALYRSVAWFALQENVSLRDEQELVKIIDQLHFQFLWDGDSLSVLVGEQNVSACIRTDEIGSGASIVSQLPKVRQALLGVQKKLAEQSGVVMDGRDIGTVIIPQAELKVFVDADLSERARRRHVEYLKKGMESDLEQVKIEIAKRDSRDKDREVAPLRQAEDAFLLDTTHLSIPEGVQQILVWAQEKIDKLRNSE